MAALPPACDDDGFGEGSLRMVLPNLSSLDLPRPEVPLYHEVFNWEGDETVLPGKWVRAVGEAFGSDFAAAAGVSEAYFSETFVADPLGRWDPRGFFFIMNRGDVAGTAFAWVGGEAAGEAGDGGGGGGGDDDGASAKDKDAAAGEGKAAVADDDDGNDERGAGQLHWLAVPPPYQRQGIGRCLALLVLARHKEQGRDKVFLRTEAFRHGAIRLYRSLGFVPWPRDDEEKQQWAKVEAAMDASSGDGGEERSQ